WSSDVCSSDLLVASGVGVAHEFGADRANVRRHFSQRRRDLVLKLQRRLGDVFFGRLDARNVQWGERGVHLTNAVLDSHGAASFTGGLSRSYPPCVRTGSPLVPAGRRKGRDTPCPGPSATVKSSHRHFSLAH